MNCLGEFEFDSWIKQFFFFLKGLVKQFLIMLS